MIRLSSMLSDICPRCSVILPPAGGGSSTRIRAPDFAWVFSWVLRSPLLGRRCKSSRPKRLLGAFAAKFMGRILREDESSLQNSGRSCKSKSSANTRLLLFSHHAPIILMWSEFRYVQLLYSLRRLHGMYTKVALDFFN